MMTFPALEKTFWYQLMPAGPRHHQHRGRLEIPAPGGTLGPLMGTEFIGSLSPASGDDSRG
ncbi:hypothetical protein [Arthrobacter sp. SO3]|uniref:hypothetical protein n=1 Tax=Arthrobacter sp. SO3 TaxID=1897057 RepID=UPI001CFFD9D6|nr:hypothetical protein [Arthrobacter sp. SO3]